MMGGRAGVGAMHRNNNNIISYLLRRIYEGVTLKEFLVIK